MMLMGTFTKIFAFPIDGIIHSIPWNEWIEKAGHTAWNRLATQGMYEVQEYESILELLDTKGQEAIFHKRQRVRYLQDNIIAYQDQAWGDGRILLNYSCAPGFPVDRYQLGHKTLILISLREFKQRGDMDEFNIQWGIRNGFRNNQESWETEISHITRHIRLRVIFPSKRPPLRAISIEASRQVIRPITMEYQRRLADGRLQVVFETERPRINERYIVKWDW